jgi:hypothetical protein
VEVCNAAAIPGNAGKYISMANGLIVDSDPRIRIIKVRFRMGWDIIFSQSRGKDGYWNEAKP